VPGALINPCRVYLRRELAKLKDPDWAAKFEHEVEERVRATFRLDAEAILLSSM
jgi:hypothetical protein